jgi:hypothetical protein
MKKLYGIFIVLVGILCITLLFLAIPSFSPSRQEYGISFSAPQAEGLGLNWKETYLALLNDVGVKHLRLSAYWDSIESKKGVYDFSVLDYQMSEAAKHNADVLLSVGRKLPRWPECHIPQWAKDMSEEQQQRHVLTLVSRVVERYKDNPVLRMWQLENEPLLSFGICPPADTDFLSQEQELVRKLDSSHEILITDSGELNSWLGASQYGDMLGTTMYRTVFSKRTQKLFHYDYLFPSWLYRIKARYVGILRNKEVIISELQGEPWGSKPFVEMSQEERRASFSPERFMNLARFAKRTQFPLAYWWGAEYWYWEQVKHNDSSYMDIAKNIFSSEGGESYGK